MGKPSRTFIRHFQTGGFHSHLFEIACFAYLESAKLNPERTHTSPDFLAACNGNGLAFEATTSNPAKQSSDISLLRMKELSQQQLVDKVNVEFPRRMTSIFQKKLRHKYHQLPQCAGKPIILMVAPFFEPGSLFYIDESLLNCLYGINNDSSGFFFLENANSISAIMYCNQFTVSRFLRLATPPANNTELALTREGWYYAVHQGGELFERQYKFQVGEASSPQESWAEGVTVFHNPNALIPIPTSLLPCTSHFSVEDGRLTREVIGFHPLTSFTTMSPK